MQLPAASGRTKSSGYQSAQTVVAKSSRLNTSNRRGTSLVFASPGVTWISSVRLGISACAGAERSNENGLATHRC